VAQRIVLPRSRSYFAIPPNRSGAISRTLAHWSAWPKMQARQDTRPPAQVISRMANHPVLPHDGPDLFLGPVDHHAPVSNVPGLRVHPLFLRASAYQERRADPQAAREQKERDRRIHRIYGKIMRHKGKK
jgi:hypothetical protein